MHLFPDRWYLWKRRSCKKLNDFCVSRLRGHKQSSDAICSGRIDLCAGFHQEFNSILVSILCSGEHWCFILIPSFTFWLCVLLEEATDDLHVALLCRNEY